MSMYGPYRRIVAVGDHKADGTDVTLECGHVWKLVSHAHMSQRDIGGVHPCGQCKAEAKEGDR